jgi:hypothetical protein
MSSYLAQVAVNALKHKPRSRNPSAKLRIGRALLRVQYHYHPYGTGGETDGPSKERLSVRVRWFGNVVARAEYPNQLCIWLGHKQRAMVRTRRSNKLLLVWRRKGAV